MSIVLLKKFELNETEDVIDQESFNVGCPIYKIFLNNLTPTTSSESCIALQFYNGIQLVENAYDSCRYFLHYGGFGGDSTGRDHRYIRVLHSSNLKFGETLSSFSGEITIQMPVAVPASQASAARTMVHWTVNATFEQEGRTLFQAGTGYDCKSAYAATGFRLFFADNSQKFGSGTVRVYGITE